MPMELYPSSELYIDLHCLHTAELLGDIDLTILYICDAH